MPTVIEKQDFSEQQLDGHTIPATRVVELLNSNASNGLSNQEAERRKQRFGSNLLPESPGKPWWKEILEELTEPMILLLLVVGILYVFLGEIRDAITIIFIILATLTIEIGNENRAKKAIKALARLSVISTPVIRGGTYYEVPASELVVGDIVLLHAGQRVPADIRLCESSGLKVDESSLTGESLLVEKKEDLVLPQDTALAEQANLVFSGSLITGGNGKGIVIGIGSQTELGKIVGMVSRTKEPKTPLQNHMRELTRWMVWIALGFSILIASVGWLKGASWRDTILSGLSLAFATIPEELPILITMVIGLGALRLSKQNVILRRLRAAETLGNITVVATDKTGTLTENKMNVDKWFIAGKLLSQSEWLHSSWQDLAIQATVLANDGYPLDSVNNDVIFQGDATDTAFLYAAQALGYDVASLRSNGKVLEFPFDDSHKRITVQVQTEHECLTFSKGALEKLLSISTSAVWNDEVVLLTDELNQQILETGNTLAAEGYRIIAFGSKKEAGITETDGRSEAENTLTFLGFATLLDKPRSDVKTTVQDLRHAGVRVIMITGDHPETTRTVGRMVGLDTSKVLTGNVIDKLSDQELQSQVKVNNIFARTTPEHKLRIVQALQSQGEIVAVTGDGVNDGPALKQAAVGIAMGKMGTDVARESADMIIADDRFATTVVAIKEGRNLFNNLFKAIRYYLAAKVALIISTLLTALMGLPLPFTPVQIILLELFMDLGASTSFTTEIAEADIMQRPPRSAYKRFMDSNMVKGIFSGGLSLGLAVIINYLWVIRSGHDVKYAQTIAFSTWMVGHLILAVMMRSQAQPLRQLGFFSNKTMLVWMGSAMIFLFAVLSLPSLRETFHLSCLHLNDWGLVFFIPFITTVWIEVTKQVNWVRINQSI
ncbi:cation-translocating P-type ATPase [Desulfitobacterium sp. AusDCA]|uniref:cation-translocating P-type ATPase n=1 Tax=Desulfitobacterium sp. AusDCA TaxID=3240383 RepID=UPI003DA6F515